MTNTAKERMMTTLHINENDLEKGLNALSDKERDVFVTRFEGNTLEDVAEKFGITIYKVRQIEAKCFMTIKNKQPSVNKAV